jgi:membrane-bound serine protease (ClpP class)
MIPSGRPKSRWSPALAILSALMLLAQMAATNGLQDQAGGDENSTGRSAPTSQATSSPFVPGYRQANRIAVLTVRGEIDMITLASLERRIEKARELGCDGIVIELDTPGGRLDAARDIVHLMKHAAPVNKVAWINPDAFSAGTLIALSCREIVVAPDAVWGDCAPIAVTSINQLIAMPVDERAKAEAYLRSDVVDSARRYGYDENLVQAFISVGIELWMLEKNDGSERIFVDRNEYRHVFGEEPPEQIGSVTPPGTGVAPPTSPMFGQHPGFVNEFPEMTSEEIDEAQRKQIEESQTLQPRAALTSADADQWHLVGQVDSADQLLVVKAQESLAYGLAEQIVKNDTELAAFFAVDLASNPGALVRMDETWSEHLVRFLVSFPVRVVLMIIFILALLLEMAMPSGLFGVLSVAALLVFLGAPLLVGMAQWWSVLLIVAGLGLLAVEFFLIPGFGVPGFIGGAALLIGTVATFVSGDLASPEGQSDLFTGLAAIAIGLVGAGIGIVILSRHLHDIPFMRRLVLNATTDASTEKAPEGLLESMGSPPVGEGPRAGDLGTALTDLRPSGRAIFGGRALDVVTAGGYIRAGANVRATHVGTFRVEVEEV